VGFMSILSQGQNRAKEDRKAVKGVAFCAVWQGGNAAGKRGRRKTGGKAKSTNNS